MPKSLQISKNLNEVNYTDHRLDIYRQAARDVAVRNDGLERYVIGIFGPDLIGSLAFAIDPYKQFRNNTNGVALLSAGPPTVRTRTPLTSQRAERRENWFTTTALAGYHHDPNGGLFDYIWEDPVYSTTSGTKNRGEQPPLYGLIRDTTRSTRNVKQDKGEFELFIPKLRSQSYSRSYLKSDEARYTTFPNSIGQRITTKVWQRSDVRGPEFAVNNANVQAVIPLARARALAAMTKHVYSMLDQVQPSHRTYDLFYQISELRELPITLRGTLKIWQDFERIVGTTYFRELLQHRHLWRDPRLLATYTRVLGGSTGFNSNVLRSLDEMAGSAFLTFKFGWESTVRGIVDFLPSPARASREVNEVIKAIGKRRSRRTRRSWNEPDANVPLFFGFSPLRGENVLTSTIKSEGTRKCELRLMVNAHINFPQADIPRLRRELFVRKLGAYPSPSDVYNLIPWTWLLDWFGGLGDYLSLMDSIANDSTLINYGFITYREESNATLSVPGEFITTWKRTVDSTTVESQTKVPHNHEAKFSYVYQLRRSIPTLTNVREYWGSNLNPNQTAILGALASTRGGSLARRDAS